MSTHPADPPEGGTHEHQVLDLASHVVVVAQARLTSLAGRGVDYLALSPEGRVLNLIGQTLVVSLLVVAVSRRELRKLNHPA